MFDSSSHPDSSHWFVIRTHRRQESRAQANLNLGRIETFLPLARSTSRRHRTMQVLEALFPQYLFARFDPRVALHDVTFTRGVQSIVRVGGELATADDSLIDFLRMRMGDKGFIALGQKATPGEVVTIERGPFAELAGIVERNLPGRQRVIVLLATVESHVRVEVPTEDLRACRIGLAS